MPAIIVIGEALVDLFAEPGKRLSDATGFAPRYGGAPANVAVSAAKLGGDVGFIGKVGTDGFGSGLQDQLSSFGINIDHFLAINSAPTMLACVALPTPENPDFVLYSGANAKLTVDDIHEDYFQDCKVMIFGSVTLAYESEDAVLHGAGLATSLGAEVIFDVNLRPSIWNDMDVAKAKTFNAIRLSSIVKLNDDEVRFLFGDMPFEDAAQAILDLGPKLCCVSLGAKGGYFRTAESSNFVDGFEVDVVDTTGSGDAFLAGLAVSITAAQNNISTHSTKALSDILSFSNACGAVVATALGAMGAPLSREAVISLQTTGVREFMVGNDGDLNE